MVYSDFVNGVANLLDILPTITDPTNANPSTDGNFNLILPRAIEYAENRMYRELDLIQATTTATSITAPNNRQISIPASLIVMNSCYLITPAGAAPTDANAMRNPMIRTSIDFVNRTYSTGQNTVAGKLAKYYATTSNSSIQVGPAPDDAYNIEFIGIARPAPLSSTNTSTILTSYLPDIFLICAMIFLSAYQRDWSAMSDDPKMALSYEGQYSTLKIGAKEEIARAKQAGAQWQPYSTPESATATMRGNPQ